jgi:hypothetical protein
MRRSSVTSVQEEGGGSEEGGASDDNHDLPVEKVDSINNCIKEDAENNDVSKEIAMGTHLEDTVENYNIEEPQNQQVSQDQKGEITSDEVKTEAAEDIEESDESSQKCLLFDERMFSHLKRIHNDNTDGDGVAFEDEFVRIFLRSQCFSVYLALSSEH